VAPRIGQASLPAMRAAGAAAAWHRDLRALPARAAAPPPAGPASAGDLRALRPARPAPGARPVCSLLSQRPRDGGQLRRPARPEPGSSTRMAGWLRRLSHGPAVTRAGGHPVAPARRSARQRQPRPDRGAGRRPPATTRPPRHQCAGPGAGSLLHQYPAHIAGRHRRPGRRDPPPPARRRDTSGIPHGCCQLQPSPAARPRPCPQGRNPPPHRPHPGDQPHRGP
jgi:hypothetical protein